MFFLDVDAIAGARIAAGAGVAPFHGKSAETAQFDTVAACERRADLVEYRRNDAFD